MRIAPTANLKLRICATDVWRSHIESVALTYSDTGNSSTQLRPAPVPDASAIIQLSQRWNSSSSSKLYRQPQQLQQPLSHFQPAPAFQNPGVNLCDSTPFPI